MARVPQKRLIRREDYPEQAGDVIESLGQVLNIFMEEVIEGFEGRLDYNNLNQSLRQINIVVDADGNPNTRTEFRSLLTDGTRAGGITCIRAQNLSNPSTVPTGTPFITFTEDNNVIRIQNVTNLQENERYLLNLLVFSR